MVIKWCKSLLLSAYCGLLMHGKGVGIAHVSSPHDILFLYRYMSAKAARTDPSWNPSIVGRELLKPKFYDVWFEVSGKNQALAITSHPPKPSAVAEDYHHRSVGTVLNAAGPSEPSRQGGQSSKRGKDCGSAIKEMQRLMQVQLQVFNNGLKFDSLLYWTDVL